MRGIYEFVWMNEWVGQFVLDWMSLLSLFGAFFKEGRGRSVAIPLNGLQGFLKNAHSFGREVANSARQKEMWEKAHRNVP